MTYAPEYIAGTTTHVRRGTIGHKFSYNVDYVLIDPEETAGGPALFSRNAFNLASVQDRDHGGAVGAGHGPAWARAILEAHGLGVPHLRLYLLTQPRFFGLVFNPVSFWLAMDGDDLRAVIAEVTSTFGDRHSYLCSVPDFEPITGKDRITSPKSLHVSPFQDVAGSYTFGFDIRPDKIAIHILHQNGAEGVMAMLAGSRCPLTNAALLRASLRRPLGGVRTLSLIHWQALRLKLKGAKYRTRPTPPKNEIT
jgi:hypothetical protein